MSKYDLNIKQLSLLLLPTFWRRPLFEAVIYGIATPLHQLLSRFQMWKQEKDYRLLHNGQVCRLRALLNDRFDPVERRITVTEQIDERGRIRFALREKQAAVPFPARETDQKMSLNRRGYGGVNGYDFWVNIPISIRAEAREEQVRALVNGNKLASKRFSINFQ